MSAPTMHPESTLDQAELSAPPTLPAGSPLKGAVAFRHTERKARLHNSHFHHHTIMRIPRRLRNMRRLYEIALLPGDGIGPEVVAEAERVLRAASEAFGFALKLTEHAVGGAGIDASGEPLPEKTREACLEADAVLLGAVGGPKWDGRAGAGRPEAGLLQLRRALGTFANLRPVAVNEPLAERSPLRSENVAGTDLLIVRELTGGIYFGEPAGRSGEGAGELGLSTMSYSRGEIERIARVAFEWARKRGGRVTSVDKANVLAVSALWREVVSELHAAEFSECTLDHLYVDNAAMQLVRDPRAFDVILTGNLFGDILSDLAATLPGSLGLLPSASLGGDIGLFEPVHGSAPDIAGQGRANPLGTIGSAAMLLDDAGEADAAESIRNAIAATLTRGVVTADMGGTASTAEVGDAVASGLMYPVAA